MKLHTCNALNIHLIAMNTDTHFVTEKSQYEPETVEAFYDKYKLVLPFISHTHIRFITLQDNTMSSFVTSSSHL